MCPLDDDYRAPLSAPSRDCPDCRESMRVTHHGEFGTLYVCPKCQLHMTLPPHQIRNLG